MANYDYLAKVVLVGDTGVGKTCLLAQYARHQFMAQHVPTIGIEFETKIEETDGKTVKAQIWDTAGNERFRSLTKSYYRGAYAVIIVFDVTDRVSFDNVKIWMNDLRRDANDIQKMLLVGNKCDVQERTIDYQTAKDFADSHDLAYAETSAKSTAGVNEAFRLVLSRVVADGGGPRARTGSATEPPLTSSATTAVDHDGVKSPASSPTIPPRAKSPAQTSLGDDKPPFIMKVILVGGEKVGKSSLVLRYTHNQPPREEYNPTIGVDFTMKTISVEGSDVRLQIWDLAGQERFRTIVSGYYRNASAVLLVYDVTNEESLPHLDSWLEQVESHAPVGVKKLLIGNKCDETRIVDYDRAKKFAKKRSMHYIETSAKEGTNVDDAFRMLVDVVELERPIGRGVRATAAPMARTAARSSCCTVL